MKLNDNCIIYQGDAYNMVKAFKNAHLKVNHIIADPPYNVSQKNNFHTLGNRKGLDFGEWDWDFDLYTWIGEYTDLLDKNGSILIFCGYKYLSHIYDKLEQSGIDIKDVILWNKTNPMPRNINRRYVQSVEFCIWGVKKGAKWVFNKPEDVAYLKPVYEIPLCSGKERLGHPTQKSLKLMEELIKVHTNENDIILDPFMGSGSTGVACLNLGRRFIGVELSTEYFNMAKERLEKLL